MPTSRWVIGLLLGFAVGCGGSAPPPDVPAAEPAPEPAAPKVAEPEETPESVAESGETAAAGAEPEFRDGMSVDEAINAVPQGSERANIDQEALGKPISDMSLYEPCNAKETEHVRMRIAVWDGRAVGIDLTVTPKNERLAECVKEQLRKVTWRDKEKSLNTVEFAF
ncbi:MAG: hypothetical protein R3B13_04535 [Polyangiaceae bacterium]